mmetsp:Transcript_19332/g.39752  ORF Transcript_19332/g.39752 Transcript_19332/m.39752 type:complete len:229 (-) Transcript_19332:658-1344(-)
MPQYISWGISLQDEDFTTKKIPRGAHIFRIIYFLCNFDGFLLFTFPSNWKVHRSFPTPRCATNPCKFVPFVAVLHQERFGFSRKRIRLYRRSLTDITVDLVISVLNIRVAYTKGGLIFLFFFATHVISYLFFTQLLIAGSVNRLNFVSFICKRFSYIIEWIELIRYKDRIEFFVIAICFKFKNGLILFATDKFLCCSVYLSLLVSIILLFVKIKKRRVTVIGFCRARR